MKLSEEQIQKYSEMFHQPASIVKSIGNVYDNIKDIEENLYLLGEDSNDTEDEDDEIDADNPQAVIEELLPKIKRQIANKLGIHPDELEGELTPIRVSQDIFVHHCPFNQEQQKNIDCNFCPLHRDNMIPLTLQCATEQNITIPEAADYIKFMTYRFTDDTYEKIISDQNKAKENDTNT